MASRAFGWEAVEPSWTAKILEAAYRADTADSAQRDHSESLALLESNQVGQAQLANEAERLLGSPPHEKYFATKNCGPVFREWLVSSDDSTILAAADLWAIYTKQASFGSAAHAKRSLTTAPMAKNLRKAIRKTFIQRHKVERVARATTTAVKVESQFLLAARGEGRFEPYPHQSDAWLRLDELVPRTRSTNPLRGLLVLPTGAGKTSTMTEWLVDRHLATDNPPRVLWLAHQRELLTQARDSFQRAIARQSNINGIRGRIVGAGGGPVSTLGDAGTQIALVSIQSLIRDWPVNKRAQLRRFVDHRPTIVVVDEAHHGGAVGYDKVLDELADRGVVAIIGLTATPQPTGLESRRRFAENFPTLIHEVDTASLIKQEILSKPVLHEEDTEMNYVLTDDERNLYKSLRDLPPSALRRLDSDRRNTFIRDRWNAHRDLYGKTLIFASDRDHADHLGTVFGTAAATRVLHGATGDRTDTLAWFRNATGPVVLVSVGMLTEGVDLPSAQTAIIARPTTSAILLRQMIGRVLRGPRAGGSAMAHVVWLRDHFDGAPDLLSPLEIFDSFDNKPKEGATKGRAMRALRSDDGELLTLQQEAELARLHLCDDHSTAAFMTRIVGFYDLGDRLIPVYEHQLEAYHDLIEAAARSSQGNPWMRVFDEVAGPFPSDVQISLFVEQTRLDPRGPAFLAWESTNPVDEAIDHLLHASNDDHDRIIDELYERTIARDVFPTTHAFAAAIRDERDRRTSGGLRDTIGSPPASPEGDSGRPGVKPPTELLPRVDESARNLEERLDHVLNWIRTNLPDSAAEAEPRPAIRWSRRVNVSTLGVWVPVRHGRGQNRGRITTNRLLLTEREHVGDDMLDYLIYHEVIHHMRPGDGHDAEFRRLEALWPNGAELDTLFDTLGERWDISKERYNQ